MIHRNIFHNGSIVPVEETRLSPGQAGLMNGYGLFTTMRIFRGQPFAFERHWRRLKKDAGKINVPFVFDPAQVRRHLSDLLLANNVTEGTARIYMINNYASFWQSAEVTSPVELIMLTAGLPAHPDLARLTIAENGRFAASPLSGVKTTAWLNNIWHLTEAQKKGWTEVILLNERGEVAECTSANIFCAKDGTVLTPPLSSGCLEGVTRGVLLEVAAAAGIQVLEQTLRPEDLFAADEVFITSTNRSLLDVGEIAGHRYPAAPGPIAQKLERLFESVMREYVLQGAEAIRG